MKLTRAHIERIQVFDRSLFAESDFPYDWLNQLCALALDRAALLEQAIRLCEQQLRQEESRGRLQARSILTRTVASLRALLTATGG